jgi:hypothetical protein
MKGTFVIIRERAYPGAVEPGGSGDRILTLLDVDNEDSTEPLDYILENEELKYSGKCRLKKAEFAISHLRPTGEGILRIHGRILSVK